MVEKHLEYLSFYERLITGEFKVLMEHRSEDGAKWWYGKLVDLSNFYNSMFVIIRRKILASEQAATVLFENEIGVSDV